MTPKNFSEKTGAELLVEVGLLTDDSYDDLSQNEFVTVFVGTRKVTVWATVGYRGYALARYCHFEFDGKRKVRGLGGWRQVPDTFHYIGTLDTVLSEYQEVKR